MGRVNWEDDDEIDRRFELLCNKVGDRDKARGILLRFRRLAQDFWAGDTKAPSGWVRAAIPVEEYEAQDFAAVLLETRWAVRYDGSGADAFEAETDWPMSRKPGIIAGSLPESEKRFGWYWTCCEKVRQIAERRRQRTQERLKVKPAPAAPPGHPDGSPPGQPSHPSGSPPGLPEGDLPSPLPFPFPFLSPTTPLVQARQGASRRDFDRDADKASAEVLGAIERGWGADHMRRELSTTAQLLIAKRWSSLAAFAEAARVHRGPRDYEIFTSNLRRDFRALRQGLPAPPPSGDEEAKRKLDDMLEGGGGEHERQ